MLRTDKGGEKNAMLSMRRYPMGFAAPIVAVFFLASCEDSAPGTDAEFRASLETMPQSGLAQAMGNQAQQLNVTGSAITVLEGDSPPITYHLGRSKPQAQFQAASMSKAVAAAVILSLAEREGVGLDDDIRQQISSLKGTDILPKDRPVTLRQLLSNTSGSSVHGFRGYSIGDELPSTFEIITDPPGWFETAVNFNGALGEFDYSGGGFMVAQLWAEDVSGEDFPWLASRLILNPLELDSSSFVQTGEAWIEHVQGRVGADGDGLKNSWNNYPEHAAAGLWTTSEDYATFAMTLVQAASGEPSEISGNVARAIITPQVQLQGQTHYGLGTQLYLNEDGTVRYVSHSGGNAGYRTLFSASPARDDALPRVVVALTNTPSGAGFSQDVVYGLMGREPPYFEQDLP